MGMGINQWKQTSFLTDKNKITKDECFKIYKALTKDTEDPLVKKHG